MANHNILSNLDGTAKSSVKLLLQWVRLIGVTASIEGSGLPFGTKCSLSVHKEVLPCTGHRVMDWLRSREIREMFNSTVEAKRGNSQPRWHVRHNLDGARNS